jgi:hypothetical protein
VLRVSKDEEEEQEVDAGGGRGGKAYSLAQRYGRSERIFGRAHVERLKGDILGAELEGL